MHFLYLLLLSTLSLVSLGSALDPTANFTTSPEVYHVGRPFTGQCTIANLDPFKVYKYTVVFSFYTENEKLIDHGNWVNMAQFSGVGKAKPAFRATSGFDVLYGLVASQGSKTELPALEVNINPKTALSKGKYACALIVYDNEHDDKGKTYTSNEWLGNGNSPRIVLPSVFTLLAIAIFVMTH